MPTTYTSEQVAELLHLSCERVRTLARVGAIPSFRLPGRCRRLYPADQIHELLQDRHAEPQAVEAAS